MAHSNPGSPVPPEDASQPSPERISADEDAIDLGGYTSSEDGESSSLSFSGRSGARSGSSVITWNELVRKQSPGDEPLEVHSTDNDVDADSDKNLLREFLADEPSPSGIIYKDPSAHEIVLPPPSEAAPSATDSAAERKGPGSSFILPPELEVTKPADASVEPQQLGNGSHEHGELRGDSSRVNLVDDGMQAPSSGSLGRTDDVGAPPIVRRPGERQPAPSGEAPPPAGESSAVDLGSQPIVELPFPLGVDSSVGSSVVGVGRESDRPAAPGQPDSGVVDLLASSDEFELSLRTPGPSTADELRARENPPTTVPLALTGPSRTRAWVGGGLIGLFVGLAASLGLMFSGLLPVERSGRSSGGSGADPGQAAMADKDAALAEASAAADQAVKAQADLGARLARAEAEATQGFQAKAELDRLNGQIRQAQLDPATLPDVARQLAQARAAADEARQARAKLDALTGQLQQARLDPSDLPAALRQLSEARAAAEDAVKSTETQLARLREQLNLATAEARTVEDRLKGQLAQMTTARQGLTAFVQEVARRLQAAQLVAPNPAATELLAGLDRALARRPGSAAEPNPAQAEQHYTKGYRAYRGGDYAEAEQRFAAAELANDRDARYPYFLGLARLAQGKSAAAVADFRRGAALEQQNLPNAAEVDRALEAVPRDARLAIGRYRP